VSNEALCVITGLTPINIKIEETAKYYECIKGHGNLINLGNGSKILDTSCEICQNYRRTRRQ